MLKTRYHKIRLRLSLWRCRLWNWLRTKFASFRLTKRGQLGVYLLVVLTIGAFFVSRFENQPLPGHTPEQEEEVVTTVPNEASQQPEEREYRQEPPAPPGGESQAELDEETAEPTEPVISTVVPLEKLQWPLANASIQCGYTLSAKSATLGDWRPHLAVDFAAERGAEVRAVAAGTVTKLISNDPYWGTYIHIDHGGGWISSYSNIHEPRVQVGERVAAGQVIGLVEENPPIEMVDELHMHFTLLHNGQPIDPSNRWQP